MHNHQGLDNRCLGRIDSDEEFSKKIRHVMKLQSQGVPVSWYRDKFNRLRVHRNNVWWVIDDLCKVEPKYDWTN